MVAPSADEGDGEMVDWTGFDALEPAKEPAEPELEGASHCAALVQIQKNLYL